MGSRANATIAYGIDFGMRLDWDVIDEPEPFAAVAYGQSGACSYVLALPETVKEASAFHATPFDPGLLHVDPDRVKALLAFCNERRIIDHRAPGWVLCAFYG